MCERAGIAQLVGAQQEIAADAGLKSLEGIAPPLGIAFVSCAEEYGKEAALALYF